MPTAFELIEKAASWFPDAVAIVDTATGDQISYGNLVAKIEDFSRLVGSLDLPVGSTVSVLAEKSVESICVIFALNRIGLVPAILNSRLKWSQALELSVRVGAKVMFLDQTSPQAAEVENDTRGIRIIRFSHRGSAEDSIASLSPIDVAPFRPKSDDTEFIFFTSGTTNLPKGVRIPVRATEPRVLFLSTQIGHVIGRHNQIAGVMPIFHVIGFYAVLLMALSYGGTYYLYRDFDAEKVVGDVERRKLTSLFVTPTHVAMLLDAGFEQGGDSTLQNIVIAGSSLDAEILNRLRVRTCARITNIYGTTETMNALYMNDPDVPSRLLPSFFNETRVQRYGDAGYEECAVGEEGELTVNMSGTAMFSEYVANEQETLEKTLNGWYRTGDAAIKHPDGSIDVLGRMDDTIISGGENIHPFEVEETLRQFGSFREVAAVGLRDPKWGEIVVAAVVVSGSKPKQETIDAFLKTSDLANFKRPRAYYFLGEIPKTPLGKVDRKALIDIISET